MHSLKRNVEINGLTERVEIVQAALGASEGVARFTVGLDTTNRFATGENETSQEVDRLTLDQVAVNCAPVLIKMDVEGFEADVVAGGMTSLACSSLLAIITENASPPVSDPIEAAGFKCCCRSCSRRRE